MAVRLSSTRRPDMHGALALGLVCAVVGGCGAETQPSGMRKSAPDGGEADYRRSDTLAGHPPSGSTAGLQDLESRSDKQSQLVALDDSESSRERTDAPVVAQAPANGPARQVVGDGPAVAEPPAAANPAKPDGGNEKPAAPPVAKKPSRRIIYVATLELVVSDFAAAEQAIPDLVKKFDGYVSESGVSQRSGAQRGGRWVVRIPVDGYDLFLKALGELGVPENLQQNAQDVTQEFIDIEARMANQKRLEDRILKLLDKNEGGIKDVIEVERELARVRSEIETMEGRLRYLRSQTALTTVTINVREQQNYTPPQAPTFAGKIGRTWSESLRALRLFGQGLVLLAVALAPWFAIAAPFAGGSYWYWRRSRRAIDI